MSRSVDVHDGADADISLEVDSLLNRGSSSSLSRSNPKSTSSSTRTVDIWLVIIFVVCSFTAGFMCAVYLGAENNTWLTAQGQAQAQQEHQHEITHTQSHGRSVVRARMGHYLIALGLPYLKLSLVAIAAAQRYVCVNRSDIWLDHFIFANHDLNDLKNANISIPTGIDLSRVHLVPQIKRGWPYDSDLRFEFITNHTYDLHQQELKKHAFPTTPIPFTHFMWTDADNHFVSPTCDELFGDLVAVRHGYVVSSDKEYPYETGKQSTAYIDPEHRFIQPYYSAHFFAATVDRFRQLASTLAENTRIDRANGVQARVDDESHLNSYFDKHSPSHVLSHAYAWPENHDGMNILMNKERTGTIHAYAIDMAGNKPRDVP